ncbi:MBL fold metallo-hydrolase [Patulibacter sp. NPDC049589]|uniref:MBL fold metallo-hydrolase n=1 Tax=Patulibacter sp. NPDC049589 TaxID=3154731 RepID=UPI0034248DE9
MQLQWYGQSAFRLTDGTTTVVIDPFDPTVFEGYPMRFAYPAFTADADLLLVTHEHADHNGVEVVGGDPVVVRSTAGTFDSPVGPVVSVASEHDAVAGTERGANTILVFTFGGRRIAHLGDLGQSALRPEQIAAIGPVDLLFAPVGGGPTVDAEGALAAAAELGAKVVVPMHYRTERTDFLDPIDAFAEQAPTVVRADRPVVDLDDDALWTGDGLTGLVPAAP